MKSSIYTLLILNFCIINNVMSQVSARDTAFALSILDDANKCDHYLSENNTSLDLTKKASI